MKVISLTATLISLIWLISETIQALESVNSCDGISNEMRSQICVSGQCPLNCGYTNSSQYFQCDQVCVVHPCPSLNCKTSNCIQRCLSGGCNSLACSSADCTQTCLGNCSEVTCTVTAKCNQQCERGHCGLRAIGGDVAEQICAENCGLECSEGVGECNQKCGQSCTNMRCKAKNCVQTCTKGSCNMYCDKGAEMCVMSCPGGNCKLHCDGTWCKRDCYGAGGCERTGSGKEVKTSNGNAPGAVSVTLPLLLAWMAYLLSAHGF